MHLDERERGAPRARVAGGVDGAHPVGEAPEPAPVELVGERRAGDRAGVRRAQRLLVAGQLGERHQLAVEALRVVPGAPVAPGRDRGGGGGRGRQVLDRDRRMVLAQPGLRGAAVVERAVRVRRGAGLARGAIGLGERGDAGAPDAVARRPGHAREREVVAGAPVPVGRLGAIGRDVAVLVRRPVDRHGRRRVAVRHADPGDPRQRAFEAGPGLAAPRPRRARAGRHGVVQDHRGHVGGADAGEREREPLVRPRRRADPRQPRPVGGAAPHRAALASGRQHQAPVRLRRGGDRDALGAGGLAEHLVGDAARHEPAGEPARRRQRPVERDGAAGPDRHDRGGQARRRSDRLDVHELAESARQGEVGPQRARLGQVHRERARRRLRDGRRQMGDLDRRSVAATVREHGEAGPVHAQALARERAAQRRGR